MQIEPNPMDKTNSDGEKSTGNVPAFLLKVWTLVEDPATDELIYWDSSGTSFHVYDQQRFSREILPLYFKHSNIASFIRQLNMYGFRKVAHIDQGSLKIENDDVHFQHPYFQRGAKDYLQYIKRKVSNQTLRADSLTAVKNDEVSRVLTDVTQMKSKQEDMDTNLEYIKRENKLLWREVASLRQKHHKQQEIVNKLIQFLVSLVSSNRAGLTIPALRRAPLAIDSNQMPTTAPMSSGRPDVSQKIVSANTSSNYTIESPKSDFRPITPNLGTGPIIHELTEVLDAPEQCVGFSDSHALSGQRIEDGSQGQDIIALPKFDSSRSSIGDTPVVSIQQVTSPESPSSTFIKIPTAPSLQDALNYAWTTPNPLPDSQLAGQHDTDGNKALSSQLAQRKKMRQPSSSEDEPPAKKRAPSQSMSFAPMDGLTTPIIGSDDQANSTLEDLVMSSSSLDKVRGAGSREDVSLALPAFNTGDDITLNNSSQLDFLNADLDGLRGLLQDQYKLDPSVLIDLFESSNPWAIIPEKNMEGLLSGDRDNEPGTSSLDCSNGDITATGTELVQYNPKELFPELLDDGVIDDIDDLD